LIENESREFVYLPWHFRDRLNPRRTYCGRVVYERKKHAFTVKDLLRISDKVENPYLIGEEKPFNWGEWFLKLLRNLWRIFTGATFMFPDVPFESIAEFLTWYVRRRWEAVMNPVEEIRGHAFRFVILLIDFYNLNDEMIRIYGPK